MKTKITLGSCATTAAVLLAAATGQAQTVTMTLSDPSTFSDYGNAFVGNLGSSQIIFNNDYVGLYGFNVTATAGLTVSPSQLNPLYSVCISPLGNLTWSSYIYNVDASTLNPIQQGTYADPSNKYASTLNGNGAQGLNNALYLYNNLAASIDANNSLTAQQKHDEGAAMALAMYTALYNSVGVGSVLSADPTVVGHGQFTLPNLASQGSAAVIADYSADMALFNPHITDPTGYVLIPQISNPANGQDFELIVSGNGNIVPGVPEASTFISAALLMLPLGASTLRILGRKNGRG